MIGGKEMNKLKELEKQVELYEKNIESQQQSLETLKYELEQLKAEREAEFRAEQLKVEAELRRFSIPFKSDSENYTLGYRHLFFPSKEVAQKAIDTVGEERIKKYYFGVED